MGVDVDKIRADMRAAAEAALKRDGEKAQQKLARGEPLTLFDALESIGATMDAHWHGEWTGPILFNDTNGASRLILVEQGDHELFAQWSAAQQSFSSEALQDHAREALVRMCSRPIHPNDYM